MRETIIIITMVLAACINVYAADAEYRPTPETYLLMHFNNDFLMIGQNEKASAKLFGDAKLINDGWKGGCLDVSGGGFYYSSDATNPARGRLGFPGKIKGVAASTYTPPKNMKSLYQCLFNSVGKYAGVTAFNGNGMYANHNAKGFNSAYYDGHAGWVTTPINLCVSYFGDTDGNSYGNDKSVWTYATNMDK